MKRTLTLILIFILVSLLFPLVLWAQDIPPLNLPDVPVDQPTLTAESKKGGVLNITPLSLPNVPVDQPTADMGFASRDIPSLTFPNVTSAYKELRLSDFSGGLNQRDFPTEIADNELSELVNFVWEGKQLAPRDGFTTYYDMSEFASGKGIWGLYCYYKQNGSKIVLAGIDDSLFADTNASGNFFKIKGGLQANSKYYDFDTFGDKVIVAHEGDYPFWYDGDSTDYIGLADSGEGTLIVQYGTDTDNCRSIIITGKIKGWKATGVLPRNETSERRRGLYDTVGIDLERYNVKIYEVNRWAGYTLDFVDTSGNHYWYEITDNYGDTIFLEGQNAAASMWAGTYYIYSYFDNQNFGDYKYGYIYSSEGYVCIDTLVVHSLTSALADSLIAYKDSGIVMRIWQGFSVGQEQVINDFYEITPNVAWGAVINHKYDTINVVSSVSNVRFYRKKFWHPSLVEVFKNRLFLANMEDHPNLVVFSEYNSLGDFPPDNYFVVKTQDGDHITGLATFYDDQLGHKQSKDCLVIFKRNSIYKLVWNSSTDYHLVQVVEGIGCVAPNSIVNIEGKYLLFLHTTGVYAFDGRTVTLVSQRIQPTVDTFNELIYLASAGYYNRHYYLSYSYGGFGSNRATIVFNVDLGSWTTVTYPVAGLYAQQSALDDTTLLFTTPSLTSCWIYKFGKVTTDTGQAIPLTLKSKVFSLGDIHKDKRFVYFDMDYSLDSDWVRAWFYTSFGDSLRYNEVVSQSGGDRHVRIPVDTYYLGRNFSFKLTSEDKFKLGSISLKFLETGE